MYTISNLYKNAIKANSRNWKFRGEIITENNTKYSFDENSILKGSSYLSNECSGNSEIQIGTVYSAEFGITLISDIDRYSLRNAKIYFFTSLEVEDEKFEEIPIGIFNIVEANRNKKTLEIRAYDNMILLEKPFSNKITGGTIYDMLSICSNECGIEFAQNDEYFNSCTNGTEIFGIFTENDIDTWRDLVSYIAQVMGSFATINREGKLEFRKYGEEIDFSLSTEERFESSFSDFITKYTSINSTNMRTKIAEYYALEEDDALTMNLGVNPLLQYGLEETRKRVLIAILNDISKINYLPFDCEIPVNPAIDLGDIISFKKGSTDETKISCITGYSIRFGDKMKIKCVGKNPILAISKSKNDKNIVGLLNQVETTKIATHTYINAPIIHLKDTNTLVSSIEFASKDETDAHYMASILLEVKCNKNRRSITFKPVINSEEKESDSDESIDNKEENASNFQNYEYTYEHEEDAIITVTYVLNDNEIETYYPIETYTSGKHILNLYYPINSLKSGSYNTFKTFIKIIGGTATIGRSQLIATISGQGLSASNKWDGRLNLNDSVQILRPNINVHLPVLKEELLYNQKIVDNYSLNENIPKISFCGNNIFKFIGEVKINPTSIQQTVEYTKSWIMSKYLTYKDNEIKLKTEFKFTGNTYNLDKGKVSKISMEDFKFKRVDNMEVNIG